MTSFKFFIKKSGGLWRGLMVILAVWLLAGCYLEPPSVPAPPSEAPRMTPFSPSFSWTDERDTFAGICFESAFDAAGRLFVIRNADELTQFFNLADNSRLCRRPVQRGTFDFSDGRIVAGLWSAGRGCTARYDVLNVTRDDAARTLVIDLDFSTEGDCPYELVRGIWIGLDSVTDYHIEMRVQ